MTAHHPPRLLAVVELGTTSIRMIVGQESRRRVEVLDELEHSVSLGRDTLTDGLILQNTTERCVSAMRSFRKALQELGVSDANVRVVATSAVREAANRDVFVDRILVATGFNVEVLDQAEVSRLTYRAVQPQLHAQSFFRKSDVLVVEVGGGSTETLLFRKGKVDAAHLYRLGSLRLRKLLEQEDAAAGQRDELMRVEVDQTITQMGTNVPSLTSPQLLLLGSEARFACTQLCGDWNKQKPCKLAVADLRKFMWSVTRKSVDEVARKYKITYTEAETLGPALFIAVTFAEQHKLKHVLVGEATLRTGLLLEMTTGETWTSEFRRQVINSAITVARKYGIDLRHARHVANYGLRIIKTLRERYTFSDREEVIYHVAALLHEIGMTINTASHHKHSRYIILNSDIFGLSPRDLTMAALVARYHRRGVPKPSHGDYMALSRSDRITVSKLAAVIRVANALDRMHSPRALQLDMHIDKDRRLIIELGSEHTIEPLQRRIAERSELFTSIFGKEVLLRARRA